MSHLALLFNLHKQILINTYWRTRRQQIITTLFLCGAIALVLGGGYAIQRFLLTEALDFVPAVILFGFILFWIFATAFTESLPNLVPRFYRSPDLNYLLALPIPANRVVAIKFLVAQLQSVRGVLFLTLMLLVAVGWALGAPWYYYLLLLPAFQLFALIPAGLGLLLGMALLRVMTARTFVRLAGILTWLPFVGIWVIPEVIGEDLLPLIIRVLDFFAWLDPVWAELIPLVSAAMFFNAIAAGELIQAGRPLLMLLLVSGVTMAIILWLARHLFYQGWLITQSAPSKAVRAPRRRSAAPRRTIAHAPWYALVVSEWHFAVRNGEMRLAFLGLLAMFAALIFVLAEGIILGEEPAAAMVVLTIAAAILIGRSLSVVAWRSCLYPPRPSPSDQQHQ
ncbi:MAG: putative ABC transporter permease subunit [Dehalococcoidia bacterium]